MPTTLIRSIKFRIVNHLEEKGFKSDSWTRDLLAAALMTAYQEGFGAGLRKVLDSMEEVAKSTEKIFKPLIPGIVTNGPNGKLDTSLLSEREKEFIEGKESIIND